MPHRIRLSQELQVRFRNTVTERFAPVEEAMRSLGVSRQTVRHRIKADLLASQNVVSGPEKRLYVKLTEPKLPLLEGLVHGEEVEARKAGAAEASGDESCGANAPARSARGRRDGMTVAFPCAAMPSGGSAARLRNPPCRGRIAVGAMESNSFSGAPGRTPCIPLRLRPNRVRPAGLCGTRRVFAA